MAGDYNNNGVVDAADYTVWRDALATGAPAIQRPNARHGRRKRLHLLESNFGATLGSGAGSGASQANVPEPGISVLLLGATAVLAGRRRARAWLLGEFAARNQLVRSDMDFKSVGWKVRSMNLILLNLLAVMAICILHSDAFVALVKLITPVETFPLSSVRIVDGPFAREAVVNRKYLLAIKPDHLLDPFLCEAGSEPEAPRVTNNLLAQFTWDYRTRSL